MSSKPFIMEPIRRKFKPDLTGSNIDKLIEKRQRKRNFLIGKKPYSLEDRPSLPGLVRPLAMRSGQNTVIKEIPHEMNKRHRLQNKELQPREFEKPEHWIMPEKPKVSSSDNLKSEIANILKTVDKRAIYSRAARCFLEARGKKTEAPTSKLSAKGYISTRVSTDISDEKDD